MPERRLGLTRGNPGRETSDMSRFLAPSGAGSQANRLVFAAWFAFIALSLLWTPAYNGDVDGGDNVGLLVPYAIVALVGAFAIVHRSDSIAAALAAAVPVLTLIAIAVIAGALINDGNQDERGEPILLYYGVTLWGSWTALVIGTALGSRTGWSTIAGVGLSFVVALLGLFLFNAQID
jgi:hypothetical protein